MAGSYSACVTDAGQLRSNLDLVSTLENGGDVYEAVEEMYGMIWYLAENYARSLEAAQGEPEGTHSPEELVEEARQCYREGIDISPGVEYRDE